MLDLLYLINPPPPESQQQKLLSKGITTSVKYDADTNFMYSEVVYDWNYLNDVYTNIMNDPMDQMMEDEITKYNEVIHEGFMNEIYKPALDELKHMGYCTDIFDPYPDLDNEVRLILYKENEKREKELTDIIDGGTIIGFLIVAGEDDWRSVCVEFIHILPKFRGLGEGKNLLKLLTDGMKKHEGAKLTLTADVYINNIASKKMFESAGFKPYCLCYDFDFEGE